jgi:hypothetical protein
MRTPPGPHQASADELAQVPTPSEQLQGQREQDEIERELAEAEAENAALVRRRRQDPCHEN